MHRRSHHALIVGVLLFAVAVESAALHWLVARGSRRGLDPHHLVDLGRPVAGRDMHAVRLRPLRLTGDGLAIHLGIRWRAFVPYDAIRAVTRAASPPRRPLTRAPPSPARPICT